MSFSRAQLRRFNEWKGCAPPPGMYNMTDARQGSETMPFETGSDRCKFDNENAARAHSQRATYLPSREKTIDSKGRLNHFDLFQKNTKSKKSTEQQSVVFNKKKEALEKEIKRLIQQLNEHNSTILIQSRDKKKLECHRNVLMQEKSSLHGQLVPAEKKYTDIEKMKVVLQSQRATKTEKLKRHELRLGEFENAEVKLEVAKEELDKCKSMILVLQSDLSSARSTISMLQKSNDYLAQLNNENQEHSDNVGAEISKLQILVDELRKEKSSVEEQLTQSKAKGDAMQKNFTHLLQNKIEEIKKQFAMKQESIFADKELAYMKRDELQAEVDKLESGRMENHQAMSDLQVQVERLDQQKDMLLETIQEGKLKLERSESQLVEAQQKKVKLEKTVMKLEDCIKSLKRESFQEKKTLRSELLSLQAEFRQESCLNNRLSALECKHKEQEDELLKVQADKASAITELISLKGKLKEEREGRTVVTRKLEVHSEELVKLKRINDSLKRNIDQHAEEKKEWKERMVHVEAKSNELETQLLQATENANSAFKAEEIANKKTKDLELELVAQNEQHQAKLDELIRRLLDTQKKSNLWREECQALQAMKETGAAQAQSEKVDGR